MRKLKLFPAGLLVWLAIFISCFTKAQVSFPVNGVAEPKEGTYAFINATIVKDAQNTIRNATLVVKDGKVLSIGTGIAVPKEAIVLDCNGKYIYPSFIDIYSDYGIAVADRPRGGGFNFNTPAQLASNVKGAYGWNQAIKSDVDAYKIFAVDDTKAKGLRDAGFGTVLTHQKDGIARGTGTVVTLSAEKENLIILKDRATNHLSLNKGTSTQSYPASLMGIISLIRQSYLDGQWYKSNPSSEGVNISLQSWNNNLGLPQIFEANDKWNAVRADRVGDEFGVQFIIKGGGNEYQRISEMKATKATFILPLNYPQAMDVEDPNEARFISLADMKHWELAPTNAAAFEKADIPFCITSADLRDTKQFLANLRKAIDNGLSETRALESLTKLPASILGLSDKVGSLENGKLANFLITSGPLFSERTSILQNWVQGNKYTVKEDGWSETKGTYNLVLKLPGGEKTYSMELKQGNNISVVAQDTLNGKITTDGKMIRFSFPGTKRSKSTLRFSGIISDSTWTGIGADTSGKQFLWSAKLVKVAPSRPDSARKKENIQPGSVTYPFGAYGWEQAPKPETLLFKNATVWTNEKDGKLENSDVLVRNGKIAQIGKNLSETGARVIDATGKHLTPGIVDEHSHIAAASINEGGQTVSSEVRIKDNLNPEDINIYRQLSGGVTTSHILHGSANTIGGQTQIIKLRWGGNDNDLMFAGSDEFIKFALGENVKRTTSTNNVRYPDTRMGVEQVLADAFQRAADYQLAMKEADANNRKKGATPMVVRRDLELDALVEIMNNKRFITCHSYVQSEITAALRVADTYGFKINTFTHILEGYKVADKMKAHGAAASTFSDWWAYKNEVMDAIPYNANLMHKVGLNVAINSDDAEMARRLNQEAAKSVKYGGMNEEDAFKMVTLNPAKMLHIDDKVGSLKTGKDADLVLWSDHPLSIYAKAEKTIVDGIVYFDREKDLEIRKMISQERNRLVQKMVGEKRSGAPVQAAQASMEIMQTCSDHLHNHGLLVIEDGAQY